MAGTKSTPGVPENLQLFMDTRELLKHCPVCSGTLFDLPENSAVRVCLVHGNVFSLYITTAGYHVQVNLDGVVK